MLRTALNPKELFFPESFLFKMSIGLRLEIDNAGYIPDIKDITKIPNTNQPDRKD
jgi:hypothetical protein